MPRRLLAAALFAAASTGAGFADDLRIVHHEVRADGAPTFATLSENPDAVRLIAVARVEWSGSWRNDRNHDAAWLFYKLSGRIPGDDGVVSRHARIKSVLAVEPVDPDGPPGTATIAADGTGVFVSAAAAHQGDAAWIVEVELDGAVLNAFRPSAATAHALEMVYVPEGPFSTGDADENAKAYAAYYTSDADGGWRGAFEIGSEVGFEVGPAAGALYYDIGGSEYRGDQAGPVPDAFPKGFDAFYVMKHEVTQGDFAAFLNHIADQGARPWEPDDDWLAPENYGSIRADGDGFVAGEPKQPMNYMTFTDMLGFLDWAALRPITDLEFTKAARGPQIPAGFDYPWGSGSKTRLLRHRDADGAWTAGAGDIALSDATKEELGASYYWVMDLAGGLWERVVTLSHADGRAFEGSHGDGHVDENGRATNADWPARLDPEAGGYGYRGGGQYGSNPRLYNEYNPHSPISLRPYGGWGGGDRSIGYGGRGGRSAD